LNGHRERYPSPGTAGSGKWSVIALVGRPSMVGGNQAATMAPYHRDHAGDRALPTRQETTVESPMEGEHAREPGLCDRCPWSEALVATGLSAGESASWQGDRRQSFVGLQQSAEEQSARGSTKRWTLEWTVHRPESGAYWGRRVCEAAGGPSTGGMASTSWQSVNQCIFPIVSRHRRTLSSVDLHTVHRLRRSLVVNGELVERSSSSDGTPCRRVCEAAGGPSTGGY